jgi:tetratricopeptide (TPR) repeat protein
VVIYEPKEFTRLQQPTQTRWLTPAVAAQQPYDEVWMFGEDGAAIEWTLSAADRAAVSGLGLDPASLALYPAVGAALGLNDPRSGRAANLDGLHLLACGTAYLDYHQFQSALQCLNASKRALPGNPYPYIFSGGAEENIGRSSDAIADFSRAVALDDRTHPNPAFKPALAQARTHGSGAKF